MPRPVTELNYEIEVEFIEVEDTLDRYAGICLLLQWIKEARNYVEPTVRPVLAHMDADGQPASTQVALLAGSLGE